MKSSASAHTTRKGELAARILWPARALGVALLVVVFTLPYAWMMSSAFKARSEIFLHVQSVSWRTFIPVNPTLANFEVLFRDHAFMRPLVNSTVVAVLTVTLSVLACSMIGFTLARLPFRGSTVLFLLIISTMLIPFEAVMVPLYKVVQDLGLGDSYAALILPWICDPFMIFFFRQQFQEVPNELEDAAVIDGCSYFRVYWDVMIPCIRPAIASLAFIKFILTWDSYIWPLVAIRDPMKQVVPVAVATLFTNQGTIWEIVFAGSVVATVPVILLFLSLQRYYLQGMLASGLKG